MMYYVFIVSKVRLFIIVDTRVDKVSESALQAGSHWFESSSSTNNPVTVLDMYTLNMCFYHLTA